MTVSAATAKTFTRDEANRTLPLVRLIVRDIVDLNADLLARKERLDDLAARRKRRTRDNDPYGEELRQMQAEFVADEQTLRTFIDELSQLGIQLSNPADGTVMFPAAGNGQFRWHPGDADVQSESPENTLNLYVPPASGSEDHGVARETR
ncbi:MAG: DUF2203 family protein [Planctomycetaceae bacterium]|nr:DUF2203 family protein [Planctomycetaceae bacterium]